MPHRIHAALLARQAGKHRWDRSEIDETLISDRLSKSSEHTFLPLLSRGTELFDTRRVCVAGAPWAARCALASRLVMAEVRLLLVSK